MTQATDVEKFLDFIERRDHSDLDPRRLARTVIEVYGGFESMVRQVKTIADSTQSDTAKARIHTTMMELVVKNLQATPPEGAFAGMEDHEVEQLLASALRHFLQHQPPAGESHVVPTPASQPSVPRADSGGTGGHPGT